MCILFFESILSILNSTLFWEIKIYQLYFSLVFVFFFRSKHSEELNNFLIECISKFVKEVCGKTSYRSSRPEVFEKVSENMQQIYRRTSMPKYDLELY